MGQALSNEYVCVEFPGNVVNDTNALGTFGGEKGLNRFLGTKTSRQTQGRHELRLVLDDGTAITGRDRFDNRLLFEVDETLHPVCKGQIKTTFKFDGLFGFEAPDAFAGAPAFVDDGFALAADFVPELTEISGIRSASSMASHSKESRDGTAAAAAAAEPESAEVSAAPSQLAEVPAVTFSSFRTCIPTLPFVPIVRHTVPYTFNGNRAFKRVETENGVVFEQKRPVERYTILFFSFLSPLLSHNEHAFPDSLIGTRGLKLEQMVNQLFRERPVWNIDALRGELLRRCDCEECCDKVLLKKVLTRQSYYFVNGPFRSLHIRLGYDPRKERDGRKYQIIEVRAPRQSLTEVDPIRTKGSDAEDDGKRAPSDGVVRKRKLSLLQRFKEKDDAQLSGVRDIEKEKRTIVEMEREAKAERALTRGVYCYCIADIKNQVVRRLCVI